MSLSRAILSTRLCLTKAPVSSSCPLFRLHPAPCGVRKLHVPGPVLGPGADHKYQSQEEKDEKARATKKKQRVVLIGLSAGLVAGGLYGYLSYRKRQKVTTLGNDSQTKEFLLDTPPPQFPPARLQISAPRMAGTPCGRLICDYPGPRPKYQRELLDIPDILVFKVPKSGLQNWFQVVPSYLTKDPKMVGKTRHQQAIDIMNESQSKFDKKHGEGTSQRSIVTDMNDFINAGSVQGGEPKTQSCTVNKSEGNLNAGQEGGMEEKQREEFMEVWAEMVKTGQDKMLRETIENKKPQSLVVYVKGQTWGITVFGLQDYC